jgi:hypothetical protein
MIPRFRPFRLAGFAALALVLAAGCKDGSGPEDATPIITQLNPATLLQWTENGLDLTVTGSGFREGAVVRLNGDGQYTTYVSPSQLVAQIPEFRTHEAQTFQVSVLNPGTGGEASAATVLAVEHRPPTLDGLTPLQHTQGDGPFALTVNGANFAQGAVVRWNGANRPTQFVTRWTLTAQIPASDLEQPGAVQVTVFNPAPGGGESAPQTFDVAVRPNPIPHVTNVTPEAVIIGSDTQIRLLGSGFMPGSQVMVGEARPTTVVVSPSELRFVLSASMADRTGNMTFSVANPPPGGGPSNNVIVRVENPAPTLSALLPAQVVIASEDLTVRLTGTGFNEESRVLVDGSFVDVVRRTGSTELEIVLPARDVDEVGALPIGVFNPGPGGGFSSTLTLSLVNGVPVLTSVSPSEMAASPFFINLPVRLTGSGFISGTVVRVNGDPRSTQYVSSTEVVAVLTKDDLDEPGTLTLVAVNPAPGGGPSAPATFTVTDPPPLPPAGP